jgi:putative phosphoribosyl transferase
MAYGDRRDAGRQLRRRLQSLHGADIVVPGPPRGGGSVAFEVARALGAPLDVIVVRKLGVPYQPEPAFGARLGSVAVDSGSGAGEDAR